VNPAAASGLVTWPGVHCVSGRRGDRSIFSQLRALYTLSIDFGFHLLLTPRGNPTTGDIFVPVPVPSLVKGEGPALVVYTISDRLPLHLFPPF